MRRMRSISRSTESRKRTMTGLTEFWLHEFPNAGDAVQDVKRAVKVQSASSQSSVCVQSKFSLRPVKVQLKKSPVSGMIGVWGSQWFSLDVK